MEEKSPNADVSRVFGLFYVVYINVNLIGGSPFKKALRFLLREAHLIANEFNGRELFRIFRVITFGNGSRIINGR